MIALPLIFAYFRERPFAAALQALLLALGVATAIALLLFNTQSQSRLARDAQAIDLVIGAKGSGLQLVLSSVFHADTPVGNMLLPDAQRIIQDPRVKAAQIINLGDSVGGYRLVGAAPDIIEFYGAQLATGIAHNAPFEAVMGAEAAARLNLSPGASFVSAHGLGQGGGAHDEHLYKVTGVLAPTGSVIDRLIFTPLASVWQAHGAPESHDQKEQVQIAQTPAVTAILIQTRTPLAALQMKRDVNETAPFMAARPADEMGRLFSLVGLGVEVFRAFALILISAAALSVFAALLGALRERRGDIALLRAMGATRGSVFAILLGQGLIIAAVGGIVGVALGHGAIALLARLSPQAAGFGLTGAAFTPGELWVFCGSLAAGALAALIPAVQAYRTDITKTLSETP